LISSCIFEILKAPNYDGKDYTAEDLKSDSDMCKELVAAGFGGLRLVRDRKKSDK